MHPSVAVEKFIRHLSVSRSAATVRTYGIPLTHLAESATIDDVALFHPGEFLADLKEERGLSSISLSAYMTAISQFIEFMHTEGIVSNGNYLTMKARLSAVRGRTPQRKLPDIPAEEQFQAILCAARTAQANTNRQAVMNMRNIAILEVLRSTGCRVAEAAGMTVGDLSGNRARITGKGDRMRVVFFDEAAAEAVYNYLHLRGTPLHKSEPVFIRHDRRAVGVQPMSTTSVRNIIDGLAEQAGLDPSSVSPHKFRHRFASTILAATGNLAATQDLLGHSSPATTRIYARLTAEMLEGLHAAVAL